MLSSLHIRNYILIDSLDIEFPEGLVIVTGQTGAGKSILLGALSLLGGAKADASVISAGAKDCVVEAEFDLKDDAAARALLEENDVEWDQGRLIIRRLVSESGRSRAFVNDCPVSVGLLSRLSERLIDIHSQHKSLLLADRRFQLEVLDHYAGNRPLLEKCGAAWRTLQKLKEEIDTTRASLERMSAEGDWKAAQYRQLEEALLRPGELEELQQEQKSLSNAEQIKEALSSSSALLEGMDSEGIRGVTLSLREAQRLLSRIAPFLPSAKELEERLDSSRIELEDVASELSSLNSRIDLSPERLQAVEERLSLLYTLMKKHSCSSVEELIALRDSLEGSALDLDTLQLHLSELEKQKDAAGKEYDSICASLHQSRCSAAPEFASSITSSLKFLELDRAVFELDVLPCAASASGSDSVLFRFSSNGTPAVDVAKCASGGEISRIMLCLKEMMARYIGMPTLIFDEIDSGVSGSVADRMGQMICRMGGSMQVFAITHLPQVAAKGQAHYLVSKEDSSERVVSSIRKLSEGERVTEIARLLSGTSVTDAAIANAKSLLNGR